VADLFRGTRCSSELCHDLLRQFEVPLLGFKKQSLPQELSASGRGSRLVGDGAEEV